MPEFETVIGLEVHIALATKSKIFCGCPTVFGAAPNSQVCPVCLGLPGVLPVLNRQALDYAAVVGLALGCAIAPRFKFDRKHYYYPDLPKNFQISQYDQPLATRGSLALPGGRAVRVKRVHLEEDAGKLVHEGASDKIAGGGAALVDYNRSGMPLLEIVSEPDLREPAEAVVFLKALQSLVRYLGASDGNMEEGSLRCDANVSVRPRGAAALGAKVEIKNMNSFRAVERALAHEAARQREALGRGETVAQETRLYDEAESVTRPMRGKEDAHDYRYFPEPDLPVFTADEDWLGPLRKSLPELPLARQARFVADYDLPPYDAEVLTQDRAVADWFEEAAGAGAPPKAASNWIMTELLGALNAAGLPLAKARVGPAQLAELLRLIDAGTISGKIAKEVFAAMFETGQDPAAIVTERGLTQITDEGALLDAVRAAIAGNAASVADYRAGKKQALGFLVGQVMKGTGGKANPARVNELLRAELER